MNVKEQIEQALARVPQNFVFREPHNYFLGEQPVVNVTAVTGLMPKYGLTTWAELIGIRETFARAELIPQMESWEEMKAQITDDGCRADDYKTDKGEIGTILHTVGELLAATGATKPLAAYDEDVRPYVQALASFWLRERVEPLATEVRVYSPSHEYAGTLDLLYTTPGGYGIRDYKTSNGIYDEAHVQVEAYVAALVELGAPEPTEKQIVWLKDDGTYELIDVFAQPDEFYGLLEAKRALERRSERKKARTAAKRAAAKAEREAKKEAEKIAKAKAREEAKAAKAASKK